MAVCGRDRPDIFVLRCVSLSVTGGYKVVTAALTYSFAQFVELCKLFGA